MGVKILNENESLIKKIKTYSRIKIWGVVPFSIMAIISIVLFVILTILIKWVDVPHIAIKVIAMCMISGLIVPILALSFSEKIRKDLIIENNEDLFLKYLHLFAENAIESKSIYYDLVSLFQSVVALTYRNEDGDSKRNEILNNCMHKILGHNSHNGLANKFVYNNAQGFSELCKIFIQNYKDSEMENYLDGILYNQYLEIMKNSSEVGLQKRIWNFNMLIRKARIILLLACVSTYFFPEINSWIFNATAIILLFIEVFEKNKKD